MKIGIRITSDLLGAMRADLARAHAFAHERVGFMVAAAAMAGDDLMLLVRGYRPVADEDYQVSTSVGAEIGSDAFRKALQWAYRPRSTLIHVHAHFHAGTPEFSSVDVTSGSVFVPSFFATVPRMPQGMIVLSNDAATGTDSGFIWKTYGFAYIEELELLREAGFSPLEVIRSATMWGAKTLYEPKGETPPMGMVKSGMLADLVIVGENPLSNLKVLYGTGHLRLNPQTNRQEKVGGVKYTIKDGIVYDAQKLLADVAASVADQKRTVRMTTTQP